MGSETSSPATEPLSREQLNTALVRINTLRAAGTRGSGARDLLDGAMEALFSASYNLIVYGSLAPGGLNHGLVSSLAGDWIEGWVSGELLEHGWGAAMGHPALRWCPDGQGIPAFLLISPELPAHWPRLDEFEGLEYRRILAPFWTSDGRVWVGNVYAMDCELRE